MIQSLIRCVINCMSVETDLPVIADAPSGVLAYSAERKPTLSRTGKPKVDTSETSKRMAWVVQVVAVRDSKDRAAFAELFAHFAPRVKSFLMKSGASPDLAEECTQEVMATLWNKAHMFDPAKASVSTWIFTIARNRKIDLLRKQRRPEPEELPWGPEPEPDQADAVGLQQETEQLGQALAALPEEQRKLIEKAYYGELSHSEIAAETGLPLGTIKSRIRLALERLRHAMK
ncbi:sigma-70 family RNA polymerase sigma factor [Yoonia sp. SS1-5]|uniref:Sigma-70 family RNA polymerase sigma factor n=1 Tax=Yoonia rhodophyticola TaxID=3137370 RepID=A0AAN0MH67_9RHOB